ncbi:hypothetical protein [Streptomyces sp. NPDC060194]|uniref:hypothetical protein n=1 Tax=Streptomyces sp. NPDC060194 TaxID=3347069 RepID=UPI00365ACE45
MRSIAKAASIAALTVPLVLGTAGLASADGHDGGPAYKQQSNSATVNGGASSKVVSGFTPDGEAYFLTETRVAGPTGATSSVVASRS